MITEGARCPISGDTIDENAARINGAIVCALLLIGVLTPAKWLFAYLALDYGLKVLAGFAYSPNCLMARFIADAMRLSSRMVDAAPKRFAATIGMLMCIAASIAGYTTSYTVFYVIVGVFGTCVVLETLAGFCVGCYLFRLLPECAVRVFVRRTATEV